MPCALNDLHSRPRLQGPAADRFHGLCDHMPIQNFFLSDTELPDFATFEPRDTISAIEPALAGHKAAIDAISSASAQNFEMIVRSAERADRTGWRSNSLSNVRATRLRFLAQSTFRS